MSVTRQDMEDAETAYRILSSPVFLGALRRVEHDICDSWKGAQTPKERENLWRDLQALHRVQACLLQTLEDVAFSTKDNVFLQMLNKIKKLCRG
nr:MAG TPA: hypothetical protein [Caudoviricetes sp.]